jgi:hypothetical protein
MAAKRPSHSRQAGPRGPRGRPGAAGPPGPPANGAVKRLAEQVTEIARSVPFGISHVVHMANPKSRRVHR